MLMLFVLMKKTKLHFSKITNHRIYFIRKAKRQYLYDNSYHVPHNNSYHVPHNNSYHVLHNNSYHVLLIVFLNHICCYFEKNVYLH